MRRALLSTFDKSGVSAFAEELIRLEFEIVASGGTARLLADEGIPVTPLEELTGFVEMLGHRVVSVAVSGRTRVVLRCRRPLADRAGPVR